MIFTAVFKKWADKLKTKGEKNMNELKGFTKITRKSNEEPYAMVNSKQQTVAINRFAKQSLDKYDWVYIYVNRDVIALEFLDEKQSDSFKLRKDKTYFTVGSAALFKELDFAEKKSFKCPIKINKDGNIVNVFLEGAKDA